MNAIDPAELSAYLDGEVSVARAAEIRRALATDATLRAQFDRLKSLDGEWTAVADSAVAKPVERVVSLRMDLRFVVALVLLLALRFLPKLGDLVVAAVVLHALVLIILLAVIVRVVRMDVISNSVQ
jgi:anti-sigma factor RsiW